MKFEADIIRFLQGNLNSSWVIIFQIITLFGSVFGFIISFLLIFVKNKKLAFCLLASYLIVQFINKVLKRIIMRDRPFVGYDDIINYGGESGFSMPSGHSVGASLCFVFLIYHISSLNIQKGDKIIYGTSLLFLLFTIVLSRMVLGVHYLTDIICGIIMGILFAIISILLYNVIVKKSRKTKVKRDNERNIISNNK